MANDTLNWYKAISVFEIGSAECKGVDKNTFVLDVRANFGSVDWLDKYSSLLLVMLNNSGEIQRAISIYQGSSGDVFASANGLINVGNDYFFTGRSNGYDTNY